MPETENKVAPKRQSDGANNDATPAKVARTDTSVSTSANGDLLPVVAAHSHRKGEREEMQDSHVICEDLLPFVADASPPPEHIGRLSYYAVFDGHGGARAAEFAAENMHKRLAARLVTGTSIIGDSAMTPFRHHEGPDLETFEKSLRKTFLETYKAVDDEFLQLAAKGKPVWKDGATATTALLVNNTLFVANVGDSRAVLCRHKPAENRDAALVLTKDHAPQLFEERMRIQKAGGAVRDGRIMGVLEVSRSLGDGQYKNHGVSCVPDIKKCTLTENDRYAVIGCDGLWKSFSSTELIAYVGQVLKDIPESGASASASDNSNGAVSSTKWHTVAARLTSEAIVRGSGDNVTVVVIGLG